MVEYSEGLRAFSVSATSTSEFMMIFMRKKMSSVVILNWLAEESNGFNKRTVDFEVDS